MGSFFSDPELYKQLPKCCAAPCILSTLYGSGAIGGVINFTTKDAADFIAPRCSPYQRDIRDERRRHTGLRHLGPSLQRKFRDIGAGRNWRRSDEMEKANGLPLIGSEFDAFSGLIKGTYRIDDEQILRASYQRWDSDADDQPDDKHDGPAVRLRHD